MLEQIADKLKKLQKNNFALFEKETVARESADKSLDERLGGVEQTVGTLSDQVGDIDEALDAILEIQNALIGGASA